MAAMSKTKRDNPFAEQESQFAQEKTLSRKKLDDEQSRLAEVSFIF